MEEYTIFNYKNDEKHIISAKDTKTVKRWIVDHLDSSENWEFMTSTKYFFMKHMVDFYT